MRRKNTEKVVEPVAVKTSPVNKQFADAISLINSYNQLLSDRTLETVIHNDTVLDEITEFIEERLGSLINIGKTETFDAVEVKMLKSLLKKVDTQQTKNAGSLGGGGAGGGGGNALIGTSKPETFFQGPASTALSELTQVQVPLATTQDNLDPIVKEALQAQEQELVQLPRKHKTVDRSPTQVITTPDDINNYARAQAAAANKTRNGVVDVRKLL